MEQIHIESENEDQDRYVFSVNVKEYNYQVTLSKSYYEQLSQNKVTPKELVKLSFELLLSREGPESILRQFDASVITHYFKDFEEVMQDKLKHL